MPESRFAAMVRAACDFYGAEARILPPDSSLFSRFSGEDAETDAVVIDTESVESAGIRWRETAFHVFKTAPKPLLLAQVGQDDGERATAVFHPVARPLPLLYRFADTAADAFELAGIEAPAVGSRPRLQYGLAGANRGIDTLLCAIDSEGMSWTTYCRLAGTRTHVWFASEEICGSVPAEPASGRLDLDEFVLIAPLLLFLRQTLKEKCWSFPRRYANFTIDDPWLCRQYGYLDYGRLLLRMKSVGFHTTIAFVPWNYRRNHPEVVDLFRDNPAYYSLCYHGNNHDHREFRVSRAMALHAANIGEAVERMELMRRETGLAAHPVMVFPQKIAPAGVFNFLRDSGFLATVNGDNIPAGERGPDGPWRFLRSVETSYSGFPSLRRIGARAALTPGYAARIAAEMFLGNPLCFYSHHDFFRGTIDAFDATASFVNARLPQVKWAGLAEIARGLCLVRGRGAAIEARLLGLAADLCNSGAEDREYRCTAANEHWNNGVAFVDGEQKRFESRGGTKTLAVVVAPGETVEIRHRVRFTPPVKQHQAALRLYAALVRLFSDVRDIYFPKFFLGRMINGLRGAYLKRRRERRLRSLGYTS
jgi:hypothetical protein